MKVDIIFKLTAKVDGEIVWEEDMTNQRYFPKVSYEELCKYINKFFQDFDEKKATIKNLNREEDMIFNIKLARGEK